MGIFQLWQRSCGIRGTMTVSLSGMSLALSLCFAAGVGYMFAVFSSAPVDGVGGGGGGGGAQRDAVVVNARPSSYMPSATTSAATTAAMQRSSTSPQCVRPRPAIQIAPRSWSRRAVKSANFTQREVSTEAHAHVSPTASRLLIVGQVVVVTPHRLKDSEWLMPHQHVMPRYLRPCIHGL